MSDGDLLTGDRTRAESVVPAILEPPTRTSVDELADHTGFLRGATRVLTEDVAEVHDNILEIQLESRTDEAAKRSVPDLLDELARLGFSWREIARTVGVTVPAVRKWRNGGSATGANRRSLARLLAFVDVLGSDHLVEDVPSWLEMPLNGSPLTGIDAYCAGAELMLLLHAAGHVSSDQLLDSLDPSWRDRAEDRFEVVTADDGEPMIRMRSAD
jgi:transcriptional regulator with XRE-family HTH domain